MTVLANGYKWKGPVRASGTFLRDCRSAHFTPPLCPFLHWLPGVCRGRGAVILEHEVGSHKLMEVTPGREEGVRSWNGP